jgi:hypothetical protein
LQAVQLTDIIIFNQLIYLVAHHFTGLTTTFFEEKIDETCQKLSICRRTFACARSQYTRWGTGDARLCTTTPPDNDYIH